MDGNLYSEQSHLESRIKIFKNNRNWREKMGNQLVIILQVLLQVLETEQW